MVRLAPSRLRSPRCSTPLDPDLRSLSHPEVADNTWARGSADSNNTLQGQIGGYEFSERKANAVRAYYEWLVSPLDPSFLVRTHPPLFCVGCLFDKLRRITSSGEISQLLSFEATCD